MARYLEVERCSLHTWMRILGRTYLVLTPARRAHGNRRRLAVLWTCGVATDLGLLYWMRRRPERDGTWSRLLLNTADMAWWSSFGPDGRFDSGTSIIGVPLIAETVVRRGVRVALAGVATSGGAIAVLQRHRGRPVYLRSYRWHALAVVTGLALRRYAEVHFRQRAQERAEVFEPDWTEAYGAGQRNVAAAVDGVCDYLGRMSTWLPDHPDRQILLDRAAQARAVRGEPMAATRYLKGVLLEWREMHNSGSKLLGDGWHEPDGPVSLHRSLVADVSVAPADGLIKVPAGQAGQLLTLLEGIVDSILDGGTGSLDVEVIEPPRTRGAALVLRINDQVLEVGPADELPSAVSRLLDKLRLAALDQLRPYDPVAATFILAAGWQLNTAMSSGFDVPLRWSLPIAAFTLLAGLDVHRRAGSQDGLDPMFAVGRSLWVSAAGTVVIAQTMRSDTKSDGVRVVPGFEELELPALILSMYWSALDRAQRLRTLTAMFGIVILGQCMPRPSRQRSMARPRPVEYALGALWPMMGVGPIRTARRTLAREERQLQELFPLEQRYLQAYAERCGTEDLAMEAMAIFREATGLIGDAGSAEEIRLRGLAIDDVRRIERQLAVLQEEVTSRLRHYGKRSGTDSSTPHLVVSTLDEALHLAAERGSVVVFDIENSLTRYGPSARECAEVARAAVELADRETALRHIFFLTNSRLSIEVPIRSRVKVTVVNSARKPWIELPPLRPFRDQLAAATVCGDQLLTDGMLARRLGGTYVEIRSASPGRAEPLWPRALRLLGEHFVRHKFSPIVHGALRLVDPIPTKSS